MSDEEAWKRPLPMKSSYWLKDTLACAATSVACIICMILMIVIGDWLQSLGAPSWLTFLLVGAGIGLGITSITAWISLIKNFLSPP
jgi:hypothetical protein